MIQCRADRPPGRAPGALSNRFLTKSTELECTILLLSPRCLEKPPRIVLLAIDKPAFQTILVFVAYPLVSPANTKETPDMDPPGGPLAPLPGAETLFRVLPKPIPQK
jgi:hypothetical protein